MRYQLLSAAAVVALVATPALAQNDAGAQSAPQTQSGSHSSAAPSKGMKNHMQARQEMRKALERAGFKDIHITAESYVVRAKDPHGAPVVMMITPDEITGVIEGSGSTSSPRSGSGSNSSRSGGNQ